MDELQQEGADDDEDDAGSGKKRDPDSDSLIVRLPMSGHIRRVGNQVFNGDTKCGAIRYLTHWEPMAFAANCCVHGSNCYVTLPLLTGDEDALVQWLGQAYCFRNAEEHRGIAPPLAYERRRPFRE